MASSTRALIFLSFFILSTSLQSQSEYYKAVSFDGTNSLDFNPDVRFYIPQEFTIDIWIAIPDSVAENNQSGTSVIAMIGDKTESADMSLQVTNNRKRIILSSSISPSFVINCDFTDGQYHHIAFVGRTGNVTAFVDGEPATMLDEGGDSMPASGYIRFPPLSPTEKAFSIGSNKDDGFRGYIYTFRIWDKALTQKDINKIKDQYAWYEDVLFGPGQLDKYLHAYAHFTNKERIILFPSKSIYFTEMQGARPGKREFYAPHFPENNKGFIQSILMRHQSYFLTDFIISGQSSEYQTMRFPNPKDGMSHFTVMNERMKLENGSRNQRKEAQVAIKKALFGFDIDDDSERTAAGIRSWRFFDLNQDEYIIAIAGAHDFNAITHLRFITNQRTTEIFAPKQSFIGTKSFYVELPEFTQFRGITGSMIDDKITNIGMAYSYPDEVDPIVTKLSLTSKTRWISSDFNMPSKLAEEWMINGVHLFKIGNYLDQHVYAFQYDQHDTSEYRAKVFLDRSQEKIEVGLYSDRNTSSQDVPPLGAIPDPLSDEYDRMPDQGIIVIHDNIIKGYSPTWHIPQELQIPHAYEDSNEDKISWGGTFSLDSRPNSCLANFRGYDIRTMDPRRISGTPASLKHIFEYPQETSQDYYTTDNNMIIPYGLYFVNDNKGIERAHTVETRTSAQRKTAWEMNVGSKIEIPLVMKFSENISYGKEIEKKASRKFITTTSKTIVPHYALVLDKARMHITEEFKSEVEELKNNLLIGLHPDYSSFIHMYGTHYANAITYGGMAVLHIDHTEAEYDSLKSSKLGVEASVEGTLEGITGGLNGGYKRNTSSGGSEGFSDNRVTFNTYGGNMSRGQGWSLGHGEEVPIYLDLNPIYELLSPLFFTDEIIWTELRSDFREYWNTILQIRSN